MTNINTSARDGARARGPKPSTIRILLADDHLLVRQGLRRSLEDAGFIVVGEASDGAEAVRMVEATKPDLVLMDVSMPAVDGLEATAMVKRRFAETLVLVLTMHEEPATAQAAIDAGADGYVVKDCSFADLRGVIEMVVDPEVLMTPVLAGRALIELDALVTSDDSTSAEAAGPAVDDSRVLSPREREVLQLVAEGRSRSEIAAALYVSAFTVKNHLAHIYGKLEARNRTEAVLAAARMGIVKIR